jgi:glycerol-3-phosphate dehydrogenase
MTLENMQDFQAIQNETYDLIIIGGGINGAGVARDAAMRGLKTILLEKGDFCGGTTSWSTRLIHGGLRYLEYFEFPLVRESLHEREILLHLAPHLVKPLLLTIPMYADRSRPYWKIQAGMLLYDVLSYDKTLPAHRMLPKEKCKQLFRQIDDDGLRGAAQYYDGQVCYAERLALENLLSAEEAGARVLNYVEVTELHRQGNRVTHLSCKDSLSGEEVTVRGSDRAVVINTSGPWVDRVCDRAVENGSKAPIGDRQKVGGTKGSHIIVDPFPGAPETSLYVEAKSDGRAFFIVPWLGMYLIGTTDLRYTGDLDKIKADNDEIDYLLQETNNIIPTCQLSRRDVKFTYSGVRPLPYAKGQKPGSITRKHILHDHKMEGVANMISLIGGKLTTYRNIGEEIVDAVYKKRKQSPPGCKTDKVPLPGAISSNDARVQKAIQDYRTILPLATIHHLFSIYGARAPEVLSLIDAEPELAGQISPPLLDIKAQVVYGVQTEYARTFVDILRRRTTIAMRSCYGLQALSATSEMLMKYCGWSQEECDRQTAYYREYMDNNCIPDYALSGKEVPRDLEMLEKVQ